METGIDLVPESIRPRIEYFLIVERLMYQTPVMVLSAEIKDAQRTSENERIETTFNRYLVSQCVKLVGNFREFTNTRPYTLIKNTMKKYQVDKNKYFQFLSRKFKDETDLICEMMRLEVLRNDVNR